MTVDEGRKVVEDLQAQGANKEEIAGAFYLMFKDGKLNVEELGALNELLGFQLSDEFLAMDEQTQKTTGFGTLDENVAENVGFDQDEPQDEPQNEEDEENKAMGMMGVKSSEDGKKNSDEEDEESKAMKLMGQKK